MAVVPLDIKDPLGTSRDRLHSGAAVEMRLKITRQSLFGLRKRGVLKAEEIFGRWCYRESTIRAYELDKEAQARRNKTHRSDIDHAPAIDPSEHEPTGTLPGHNMPMEGTTGVLTYIDTGGKLAQVEIGEKHIIASTDATLEILPQVVHTVIPRKISPKCLDCGADRAEGRTRCQKCLDIRAGKAQPDSIREIREAREAKLREQGE